MAAFTINTPIEIKGLAEAAEDLPDDGWYALTIMVRRTAEVVEVNVVKLLIPVP